MPSSLTTVPPIASVCSTRPPVSVLVRAPAEHRPRGFSRGHGCGIFALRASSRVSATRPVCFTAGRPTRFHGGVQNPACLPFPVTARARTLRGRYGNVRPLRIGYAFRPRLSPRLTLGGLASPRKPWACGGGVSRAALATHASILARPRSTGGPPSGFAPRATLPYRRRRSSPARRFGAVLSPVYCRRAPTRPVSCYALFECMAASKPTSWLSGRAHILCHSARTWGPWRAVWAVSLSKAQLSPRLLAPVPWGPGIRSSARFGRR